MLDRVEVFGYRRLLKADMYVGRKTVAFVGPNEAGKSSILSALLLFTSDNPVPATDATRSQRGQELDTDRAVVRLSFTLDDRQRTLARALPIEADELRHLVFTKLASGERQFSFRPAPTLSAKVKDALNKAWPAIRTALHDSIASLPEGSELAFSDGDLVSCA